MNYRANIVKRILHPGMKHQATMSTAVASISAACNAAAGMRSFTCSAGIGILNCSVMIRLRDRSLPTKFSNVSTPSFALKKNK